MDAPELGRTGPLSGVVPIHPPIAKGSSMPRRLFRTVLLATVSLLAAGGTIAALTGVAADRDDPGRFRIVRLPPGQYETLTFANGGRAAVLEMRTDGRELPIVVPAYETLQLRFDPPLSAGLERIPGTEVRIETRTDTRITTESFAVATNGFLSVWGQTDQGIVPAVGIE